MNTSKLTKVLFNVHRAVVCAPVRPMRTVFGLIKDNTVNTHPNMHTYMDALCVITDLALSQWNDASSYSTLLSEMEKDSGVVEYEIERASYAGAVGVNNLLAKVR